MGAEIRPDLKDDGIAGAGISGASLAYGVGAEVGATVNATGTVSLQDFGDLWSAITDFFSSEPETE